MASRCAVYVGKKASPSLVSASSRLLNGTRSCFPKPHRGAALLLAHHPSFDASRSGFGFSIRAVSGGTTSEPITRPNSGFDEDNPPNWKVKMLYDGDCPLCMREVDMLRERNKQYRSIKFVDIGSDDYSPEENQGLDYRTAMGRIHAILSDGTIVTDVEAFRSLYEAVGLGWVYAITKYEPIATMANAVYGVWAKYRMQITGRPPLEEVIEAKMKKKSEVCGSDNNCKL